MKLFRFVIALLACLPLLSVAAINKTDPYLMIQGVSKETFSRIKAEQPRIQQNPEVLRQIVKEELLPYINVRYAAYKVLGPHLKKTSKEQRNSFVAAFTDYLVASYAQVLTQYTDQDIKVESAKSVPADRTIVSVRVDILDTKRPPIRLDFKLRKNKKTKEWQGF
ncbi:ABC transporter substrate-binding protein, partial [Photobacterium sanctipauli]